MPDEKQEPKNAEPVGPETGDRNWRDTRRERRRGDPLRGLFWGLLLILLGVLLFGSTQGWLEGDRWWQYFLIGLGGIFLVDALGHAFTPSYRYSNFGRIFAGIVLILIGVAYVFGFSQWWPLILIAAGVAILLSFWFRRR
jgi:hypothetical protein